MELVRSRPFSVGGGPTPRNCPRCCGSLVQLEEPTCRLCGWADYRPLGLCGICREPLPGDRQRYCSTTCVTVAGNRRKAQAARNRVRLGRCVRCGIPADATYCTRHKLAVRDAGIDWRARRRAAGRCLRCPRAQGQLHSLHAASARAQCAGRGSPLPAVRRARRDGNVLRAPSPAGQRAGQLNGFAVGPRGPASYETPQLRTSAASCRSPAANESIV